MSDAMEPTAIIAQGDGWEAEKALEKELKAFNDGLPYNRERIIERTQDACKRGILAFYDVGRGMILVREHEDAQTFAQILEKYFPGISRRTAENYMNFARHAAKLPNFKAFCESAGGWSKGLTMLQFCTEEELQGFEEAGEIRGFSAEEISGMSVRQMQRALLKAKEKAQQQVAEATEKTTRENARLKEENAALKTMTESPSVEQARKLLDAAGRAVEEARKHLTRIDWALVRQDDRATTAAYVEFDRLDRLATYIENQLAEPENADPA